MAGRLFAAALCQAPGAPADPLQCEGSPCFAGPCSQRRLPELPRNVPLHLFQSALWLFLSKLCFRTALPIRFAKHICASALQEEDGNMSSSSAWSTWCLDLRLVSSVMINVFVAVRAAEAVELAQARLRRLSPKSFLADFLCYVFLSRISWALLFLELQSCLCDHVEVTCFMCKGNHSQQGWQTASVTCSQMCL